MFVVLTMCVERAGNTYSATVEVLLCSKDEGFPLLDALYFISPLPRNLNCSLNGFCTSVHGQNHVVAKHFLDLLCPFWEHIIVESSTAEGQS